MQKRPVYLNLFQLSFPVTAMISILHRITGVILLLMIPVFLSILQNALYYPWRHCFVNHLVIWLGLTAFIFHLIAGVRHLAMDAGVAESKTSAIVSSYLVLVLTVIVSLMVGIHL